MANIEMRVWVGCLACYNSGRLVGQWTDAIDAADLTPEDIHGRPTDHKELWCFDWEGFGELNAADGSPCEATAIAKVCANLEMPVEAYAAWIGNTGDSVSEESAELARDAYMGEYESEKDFVEDFYEETGRMPETELASYIDWDRVWHGEFECSGWWSVAAPDYNVYIFSS